MRTSLCDVFGIDYPIFAFTPSEHVAAAVSKAGGLGVLGCVRFNDADDLEQTLSWLDDNTNGKPYGVDIVMPMKVPTEGSSVDLAAMIPPAHRRFVDETLLKLGVPPLPEGEGREGVLGWLHSVARSHLDVALQHRPVLASLRLDALVGRNDQQGQVHPRCAGRHGAHQVLVPRHVHHAGAQAGPEIDGREVELDGDAAATFLGEPIHPPAGERLDQRGLPVVDVPRGSDDHAARHSARSQNRRAGSSAPSARWYCTYRESRRRCAAA